ncbi:Transmembrane and coiled-coil domain-containing protein 4 [Chionoecetes opilio]|uniref:Transmembrane and coiled-coil domain-containing protein 4 n=1 Tax=Chionoecetes opilio TaxID=41210 RepID=A0A8J4YGQ1_CHIOP|nr:Transmembrane and coiled-coil domain-containing protein 4 [Chionoecetes opilio]
MQKRIGEVEEFAFDYLTDGSHLHITIAISGWLTKEGTEEFFKPWLRLYHSREQYCLRYESQYLLELGKAMDYLLQFALSMAVQETLKYTILAGIISAITWPASLLTLASVIDNPWGVCCRRSAQVGKQLAEVLLRGQHGRRPVTLIGFSLGARVIYYCLQELCRKGSAGIVQDAIMLGAPVPGYAKDWEKFRSVVSGRIINGYCQGDWLLRFLYRSSSGSLRIAGLMPVEWQDRRMFNFDLSQIVTGHMDYAKKMDVILHLLGIRTRDPYNADDPRVKKSASDYPGFTSYHGKLDTSAMRPSSSDSMLVCGHNAPLARSRSSDDLLRSRSSTLLDPSESPLPEENTKPRSLSSYDFATKKCVPLKAVGHQLSPHDIRSRSLASSNVQIDQAGMSRSLGEPEFKEQVASKGYFDFLTRKPQPSTYTSTDKATLAQDKFKRRTVSSGNLFPNKPRTSGRRELSRNNSQDQPRRQSFFQIFSKKQERIDEA